MPKSMLNDVPDVSSSFRITDLLAITGMRQSIWFRFELLLPLENSGNFFVDKVLWYTF